MYTERELADCSTPAGIDPGRLAARFAAKETVVKFLRPGDAGLSLRAIEVRHDAGGWVELELCGAAAALASDSGLSNFALSVTHEAGFASAVVVADLDVRIG